MQVDVTSRIVIHRPRTEVAAYATNPDNVPRWYANIKSVSWRTKRPVSVGSQIAFEANFLGRRLSYTYEIVELVPDERFAMRTAQGPFPMETTYQWESAADGSTKMSLRNRGEPTGFSRLLAPFMTMAIRRANQKDLLRLKQILEDGRGG
jgi:uncharacterized membrane protein